jgi:hypothetical protein
METHFLRIYGKTKMMLCKDPKKIDILSLQGFVRTLGKIGGYSLFLVSMLLHSRSGVKKTANRNNLKANIDLFLDHSASRSLLFFRSILNKSFDPHTDAFLREVVSV